MHNMLIYNLLCVVTQNDSMLRKNMYFCILEYNYQIMREIIRLTTISIVVCLMFAACLSSEDRPIMQTERQKEHIIYPSDSELFSVSPTQKVFFSKGNLQYRASTNTWRFAEHQWDYVGFSNYYERGMVGNSTNNMTSPTYDGWIDLFGWGTGDNPTALSVKRIDGDRTYYAFTDWGNNAISNGEGCLWRALTADEWKYVLFERYTYSGIRYAPANVNDVLGWIILPDNWKTEYYTLIGVNRDNSNFSGSKESSYYDNTISSSDWIDKLENHGAIFLPNAGYRHMICVEHDEEIDECRRWRIEGELVQDICKYWTATQSYMATHPYCVRFHAMLNIGIITENADYGLSVRLVCDKK